MITMPRAKRSQLLIIVILAPLSAIAWLAFAQPRKAEPTAASGPVVVTTLGACGDGKADDTDAIQRAIDHGGAIAFPRGDYRITRTIEVKLSEHGPVSLTGQGGVGRVVMAGLGPAFRFVGTHTGTADPESL